MTRPDLAVFYDRDLKWYWRFRADDDTTIDKSRAGYATRAEAWRAACSHLIGLLSKKR